MLFSFFTEILKIPAASTLKSTITFSDSILSMAAVPSVRKFEASQFSNYLSRKSVMLRYIHTDLRSLYLSH